MLFSSPLQLFAILSTCIEPPVYAARRVGVAPSTFVVLPNSAVFSIDAVPPHSVPLHVRADPPCLFFNLSILNLVSNL